MAAYLNLNLDDITADPELISRIPYSLAMYYQVLPLACEDGRITVVMAYPDNRVALALLGSLLRGQIVPVRGTSAAIQRALTRLHPGDEQAEPRILGWLGSAPATDPTAAAVADFAALFSTVLSIPLTLLESEPIDVEAGLLLAPDGQYNLTVIGQPADRSAAWLVRQATTPLLLVRGPFRPLQRILVVLRGYASDDQALDWIAPFARQRETTVTVMALTDSAEHELAALLHNDTSVHYHIEHCLHRFVADGVQAYLKFRQGDPIKQVADEVTEEAYDLLVIAAEDQGDFVSHVLTEIEARCAHSQRPILIVKPLNPWLKREG